MQISELQCYEFPKLSRRRFLFLDLHPFIHGHSYVRTHICIYTYKQPHIVQINKTASVTTASSSASAYFILAIGVAQYALVYSSTRVSSLKCVQISMKFVKQIVYTGAHVSSKYILLGIIVDDKSKIFFN